MRLKVQGPDSGGQPDQVGEHARKLGNQAWPGGAIRFLTPHLKAPFLARHDRKYRFNPSPRWLFQSLCNYSSFFLHFWKEVISEP